MKNSRRLGTETELQLRRRRCTPGGGRQGKSRGCKNGYYRTLNTHTLAPEAELPPAANIKILLLSAIKDFNARDRSWAEIHFTEQITN